MKFNLKAILQYAISIVIGGLLFWWQYQHKNASELFSQFSQANYYWIGLSVLGAMISHYSRALRWTIALRPLGYKANTNRAYLAVMVGYFANLFVPRAGEFVRSGLFRKTDKVPVNVSFGAIIAERTLDLCMLVLVVMSAFIIEFDKIGEFVIDKILSNSGGLAKKITLLAVVAIAGFFFLFGLYKYRNRFKQNFLYNKVKDFLIGLRAGLISIMKLDKAGRIKYLLLTINIWVMYFFMTYFFFFAIPETAHLGFRCGLTVLAMASIGMAIPSPGGVGSYHVFVAFSLGVYGLDKDLSQSFSFFMHSTQWMATILIGAICFAIALSIIKINKKGDKELSFVPEENTDKTTVS
ncbi:lysylphosphatidylglycerol synthase transmembrane domain-containing protein [Flexithrix dorotheae]|uniref:lysylphosphatidylglycerol synthase transmembrane domain-containing protein n=1 Tax=Flexithrix dorotheae TaxID=70993 RepID=UPI0003654B8B|nr:lysylphosphatidylglycerol synthase transmembrane domain-containing protein [Flexithrix dorotheae]